MLWRLSRTYPRLELPEMMRQNAIGRPGALTPQAQEEPQQVLAETAGIAACL